MRLLYLFVFILSIQITGYSKTIHVPGDFHTIQQAINYSKKGDVVLVADGIYNENINFNGKVITVQSESGPEHTFIDGNQNGSVVTFNNSENINSIITGFTITNGYNNCGGGIYVHMDCSPTITNNNIIKNNAKEDGGGVFCYFDSSAQIISNKINNNIANHSGGGINCVMVKLNTEIKDNIISTNYVNYNGGGISCYSSSPIINNNILNYNTSNRDGGSIYCKNSSPLIINNDISNNNCFDRGGGIFCTTSSPTIDNNYIHNNYSDNFGGGIFCYPNCYSSIKYNLIQFNEAGIEGGGIYCWSSDLEIINNIVSGNYISINGISNRGGGIFIWNSNCKIDNNTFTNNQSKFGGGIYCMFDVNLKLTNTIMWNNSGGLGPSIYILDSTVLDINYCDMEGGESSIFIEWGGTVNWGAHNIDLDPIFIDNSNDYHLDWKSPCINMGLNNAQPKVDIDGDIRINMGTTDIGADEYIGTHSLEADSFFISESKGGAINFKLYGGQDNAGRKFIILGSINGTSPGICLPNNGKILPINWDLFTEIIAYVNYPDSIIFNNFYGILDSGGESFANFDTNGTVPGMIGYTISFAYPLQGSPWDFASNPINIIISQ